MGGDLVFTQSPQIHLPENTLVWGRVFNIDKKSINGRGFVGDKNTIYLGIILSKPGVVHELLRIFRGSK
jgi:hypothetical protein